MIVLSFVLFAVALTFGIGELKGYMHFTHPYFWFAIASGAFGVFGSALIRMAKKEGWRL